MYNQLRQIIASSFAMGAAWADTVSGRHSGEVSYRVARKVHGKWFTDAVQQGRLRPSRVENGPHGKHVYLVADILALKIEDAALAEIKNNQAL